MVMHQPGWTHIAFNLAVVFLSVYLITFILGLFIDPLRGLTNPVKIAKLKKDRRWTEWVFLVTSGQIVAVNYSHAFDWPHQVSLRTWIIACCGVLGPALGFLRRWLDRKPPKPKPSEQEQPYYAADRAKRP
jgi:hypothetical protein